MNITGSISIEQRQASLSATTLMRLAGAAAMISGLGFVIVGLFHQVNEPSVVTTATWSNVHIVAMIMCVTGMFGLTGLLARQVGRIGWLGLIGYGMFSLWMALVVSFSLLEAFVLPGLAAESPAFVAGFLGMFSGAPSTIDLGAMPALWNLSGPLYIIGPLLFGIATFRARVLPRGAAVLLAVGALLIPVGGLLSPELQPLVMVPIGLAMLWLGFALVAERQAKTSRG